MTQAQLGNDVTSYQYDYENQLVGITFPDQSTASFAYDPFGRRIAKEEGGVTTNFLYDGDRVYAEYDADWDLVARYTIEGPSYYDPLISMRYGEISRYYVLDQLGSVRKLTNAAQNITDYYAYDAFGNIVGSNGTTPNPYRYVGALGYYSDTSSGLLHVGARYYAPDVGRFITQDPIGYAGGMNLYGYSDSTPSGGVDPSGLFHADTEHGPWSHDAARAAGFNDSFADAVREEAIAVDRPDIWTLGALPHFGDYDKYADEKMCQALKDPFLAGYYLGQGLHALQDKWGHGLGKSTNMGRIQAGWYHKKWMDDPNVAPYRADNAKAESLEYMEEFARKLRSPCWRGAYGLPWATITPIPTVRKPQNGPNAPAGQSGGHMGPRGLGFPPRFFYYY